MKEISTERQENEDESGLLFDLHDKMREVVTEYNDTIKGRCAVCLESLGVTVGPKGAPQKVPPMGVNAEDT